MYQNNCAEYKPRLRDIVTFNGFHEEACWYSVHDGTYYFIQPRTCNYVNQCAAQFPEGIITNYEEGKIICLDKMECSHMVSPHNQAGYVRISHPGILSMSIKKQKHRTLAFEFVP